MNISMNIPTRGLAYLLCAIDCKGRDRDTEIIRGFLPAVEEALEFANSYKNPYLCITCRDPKSLEKIGGKEFEEKYIDELLKTVFPGFKKEQFYYLVIRHYNPDGSYEINIFVVCMVNDRQFTPFLYNRDIKAYQAFGRKTHQENPLLTDPNSPKFMRLIYPSYELDETQNGLFEELKQTLDARFEFSENKDYPARTKIIDYLKEKDFEITDTYKESLSITKEGRKINVKGYLFCDEGSRSKWDERLFDSATSDIDFDAEWRDLNYSRHLKISKKYKHLEKELNYGREQERENVRADIIQLQREDSKRCDVGVENTVAIRTESKNREPRANDIKTSGESGDAGRREECIKAESKNSGNENLQSSKSIEKGDDRLCGEISFENDGKFREICKRHCDEIKERISKFTSTIIEQVKSYLPKEEVEVQEVVQNELCPEPEAKKSFSLLGTIKNVCSLFLNKVGYDVEEVECPELSEVYRDFKNRDIAEEKARKKEMEKVVNTPVETSKPEDSKNKANQRVPVDIEALRETLKIIKAQDAQNKANNVLQNQPMPQKGIDKICKEDAFLSREDLSLIDLTEINKIIQERIFPKDMTSNEKGDLSQRIMNLTYNVLSGKLNYNLSKIKDLNSFEAFEESLSPPNKTPDAFER